MNERIKELRKTLGLKQREFAERLGMKQNSIAQIEMGRNTSDQTIRLICKVFNVNEDWIRHGTEPMFVQNRANDELKDFFDKLAQDDQNGFKRRLISVMAQLKPEVWIELEKVARDLIPSKSPEAPEASEASEQESDLRAKVAELERKNQELTAQRDVLKEILEKEGVKTPPPVPIHTQSR